MVTGDRHGRAVAAGKGHFVSLPSSLTGIDDLDRQNSTSAAGRQTGDLTGRCMSISFG